MKCSYGILEAIFLAWRFHDASAAKSNNFVIKIKYKKIRSIDFNVCLFPNGAPPDSIFNQGGGTKGLLLSLV